VVGVLAVRQLYRVGARRYGTAERADLGALGRRSWVAALAGTFSACTGTGVAEMDQPLLEQHGGLATKRANATAIFLEATADWLITVVNFSLGNLRLDILVFSASGVLIGGQLGALGDKARNVVGVKYAVPDPVRFGSVARDAGFDRFVWIAGLAELSAPGYFAVGATGFTSGLVNVDPGISLEMFHTLSTGDYPAAMRVWERIRPFEELRAANGNANNVSVVKDALAQLGLCRPDVRPPSRSLTGDERQRIFGLLSSWGLS